MKEKEKEKNKHPDTTKAKTSDVISNLRSIAGRGNVSTREAEAGELAEHCQNYKKVERIHVNELAQVRFINPARGPSAGKYASSLHK